MSLQTDLQHLIEKHWGFRSLRPLQQSAMRAVLEGRDSVVVMPTGGGKSLCYQAPALLRGGTTVVVSPLISLMKDQVDSLRACDVPAVQLDSSLSPDARRASEKAIYEGKIRLLFVSPERLVTPEFRGLLRDVEVRAVAIDEVHCISHWGHDFRPEYRQLGRLKELFPGVSIHGYTATATPHVREDICRQLALQKPEVLVGNFDRPNLNYRVLPRHDLGKQIVEALDRHKNEAGIIYCIRRKDVDEVTALLKQRGYDALPYHAGMDGEYRHQVQEAFAAEKCNLIVATVAFGMGIDRSNIRFILHTGMPKSVEHYQQETGRAGRDGLEAECVLLYSGADYRTWEFILEKSFTEYNADPKQLESARQHVREMELYCRGAICRHRALVRYFGQDFDKDNCSACDICLGDTEEVADAMIVAQKILSCVARVKEKFGAGHVISVLRGENTEKIRRFGHDKLSTYGLLSDYAAPELRHLVYQLINQEVLAQQNLTIANGRSVSILALNPASWEVMRGERQVRLHKLVKKSKDQMLASSAEKESWEGVDRALFDKVRELRRELAEQREVPTYVIFSDRTLREMAKFRPSTTERMHYLHGVGEKKLEEFGERFLSAIADHCRAHSVEMDIPFPITAATTKPSISKVSETKALALEMFRAGASVDQIIEKTGRAHSTIMGYLADYIHDNRPESISLWVPDELYQRIAAAAKKCGLGRLKPIFLALEEKVPYDDIRLVVTHLNALSNQTGGEK